MKPTDPIIAYLAPELTALESTFVYDELLALEADGVTVVPLSVRRPRSYLVGHDDLLARTHYLYEHGVSKTTLRALGAAVRLGWKFGRGVGFLVPDMLRVGLSKSASWKLLYQYVVAARVAEILIREGCCHLHIHFAHVPTQIGMYAAKMADIPFTVMAHANDIFERALLLPQKAERAVKMLTISEFNVEYLVRLGVPREKLAVVRCGVDVSPRQVQQPSTRTGGWIYRIGSLGRLVEKKGFDVLIRAFATLLAVAPYRMELEIAGDGPLRSELENLVEVSGIAEHVRFLGALTHEEVANWMREIDVFVLASKADSNGDMDGIPVVLMEAMALSVPVISTRLSGIPELVIHEETGLLARSGDYKGLAVQLCRMLSDEDLRNKFSIQGGNHVRHEFGRQVNLDRLLGHFGYASHKVCSSCDANGIPLKNN